MRCGGIFTDSIITIVIRESGLTITEIELELEHLFLILTVKQFW